MAEVILAMKILQINKFFYLKGGPERYIFSVSELLKTKGHDVAFFSMEHQNNVVCEWNKYFVKNIDYIKKHRLKEQIKIFKNTLYSKEAEKKMIRLLDDFRPDIAHIHNFNHQLTPSILFALKKKKLPIVMTAHDYKLVCPSYSMLNHGKVCELCEGKRFYQCLRTKCHKNSFGKSFLVTLESYLHHQVLNSYRFIDYFLCPSKFIMNKLQKMGLKGNFVHLPNFVSVKNLMPIKERKMNKLVYWGRLSYEKGVDTLVEAVKGLQVELKLIGEGPMRAKIEKKIEQDNINNVKLLGYLDKDVLLSRVRNCGVAIIPSECYENNPVSVLEAFALGIPVIGSRIGGIPELIKDGETGLLFEPGNVKDLRDKIMNLLSEPDEVAQMGENARVLVEKKYNPELHYEGLAKVYNDAIAAHRFA